MSACPHCGTPVRYVTTEAGAVVGIDPDPHPDGTITHRTVDGQPRAHVLTGPELPAQEPAWRPHRTTCTARPTKPRPGPRCTVCQLPLDAQLHAVEPHTMHPTCDPEPIRARTAWSAQRTRDAARGRTPRP